MIITVSAYSAFVSSDSVSSDSLSCLDFIPVVVPTVVVGGMVLKSRTNNKATDTKEYIKSLNVIEKKDTPNGTKNTVEPVATPKKHKTSYISRGKVLAGGKTLLNTVTESVGKEEQVDNAINACKTALNDIKESISTGKDGNAK